MNERWQGLGRVSVNRESTSWSRKTWGRAIDFAVIEAIGGTRVKKFLRTNADDVRVVRVSPGSCLGAL